MNMPKLVADLLDRLERANRQIAAERTGIPGLFGTVDKNHPDLVKARAEVIELQDLVKQRDEQIVGLKARAEPKQIQDLVRTLNGRNDRIEELEAEKHTMAGIISGLRVWQIAAKNLLKRRKVAKRLWPKEPVARAAKAEARS